MKERYDEEDLEFNVFFILNEYADNHPEFKCKILDGIRDFYYSANFITDQQLLCLLKIKDEANESFKKYGMKEIEL